MFHIQICVNLNTLNFICKDSANRVKKARFLPRCSLFSQFLFAKIAIIAHFFVFLQRLLGNFNEEII